MKSRNNSGEFYKPHEYIEKWNKTGDEFYRELAHDEIRRIMRRYYISEKPCNITKKENKITVAMAARVNFGGVFTDIPPYCYENGGSVLNAPVTKGGMYPISVEAEHIEDKGYLFSTSKTDNEIYAKTTEYGEKTDNNDPFGLHKAVADICGLKGGISIRTNSMLPLGSGLGTSSIMAAAAIMAVYLLHGMDFDDEIIINKVLMVEQLLSSGGGWQDQCGGLTGGFSVCSSKAGLPQQVQIERIRLRDDVKSEMQKRMLVMFSGSTRSSGNILKGITEGYLRGDEDVLSAYNENRLMADMMKRELENGNLKEFGRLMSVQHDISRRLCSLHENEEIEALFDRLGEFTDGGMISGAGGGGYVTLLLKENVSMRNVFDISGAEDEGIRLSLFENPYKITGGKV